MNNPLYMYKGRQMGINELAAATGVAKSTLIYRLQSREMTVEEAVMPDRKALQCSVHMYHGVKMTIADIAERAGISAHLIRQRMRKGWTVEKAADTPRRAKEPTHERELRLEEERARKTPEIRRTEAAIKIARQIATGDLNAFRFECITPMIEYTFEGTLLKYRIEFDNVDCMTEATLTARYTRGDIRSSLHRVYKVNGDAIREVLS